MRRRVFTKACANILQENKNDSESFKKAFGDSFDACKSKILSHLNRLLTSKDSEQQQKSNYVTQQN